MTVQIRNAEMVDLLKADFDHLGNPALAWESACSAFLALPMLRGLWTMASVDATPQVWDTSGNGRTLTYNGNPTFNAYDLAPYIDLDGTGDYLSRGDEAGLDILGSETYVAAAMRGLTLGAWVWFDNDGLVATEYIISKRDGNAAANIAYSLQRNTTDGLRIQISSGAAIESQNSTGTMASGGWYFAVGRWQPSTDLSVFLNGVETAAGGSAIAALQNHTAVFQVGGRDDGAGGSTSTMDGRVAFAFLCAAALPDITVVSLYERTRRMFNV